jgi:SAM-dependent methyltransferase
MNRAATRYDWDHPETARRYQWFAATHDRYAGANRELIAHAALTEGARVLDAAAGLGHTAEAALPRIGASGRIACFEPAGAMRAAGARRIVDARVRWVPEWPAPPASFDRVLVGAAVWLLAPLADTFHRIARLLAPGGALVFTIPSLYLLEGDEPGGGADPLLLELPGRVAAGAEAPPASPGPGEPAPPPDAKGMDALLAGAGLRPEPWRFRQRLTLEAYRDWLKIPVLTERLMPGLDAEARAARLDRAARELDANSWKWERWSGWTAWK